MWYDNDMAENDRFCVLTLLQRTGQIRKFSVIHPTEGRQAIGSSKIEQELGCEDCFFVRRRTVEIDRVLGIATEYPTEVKFVCRLREGEGEAACDKKTSFHKNYIFYYGRQDLVFVGKEPGNSLMP